MTVEKRIENLENLVDALSRKIDNIKFYQDADTAGVRQSVSLITPYTETKTAFIGDTSIKFDVSAVGSLTVNVIDSLGEILDYSVTKTADEITVNFEPLENVANVTISIQ